MNDDQRKRLDISLGGMKGRPFGDLDGIAQALGREVPAAAKAVWSSFGQGTLSGAVYIYDADLVLDLLEQYEDANLAGLLPLASDGGSRDFAVDLVGRNGLAVGTILLLDRGTMNEGSLRAVAADVVEFVELARGNKLDLDGPDLATRWTDAQRAASYATPIASLKGLGANDYEIVALHYATLVPSKLVPRRNLEIAGVPCAADEDVHLDRDGGVTYAKLASNHRVGVFECRAGSLLVRATDGRVRRFTPASDVVIEGLPWKGGEEITLPDEHLDVLWGVLAEPTTIAGVPCAAKLVHLEGADRAVTQATLAREFVIDGVALPAGTWFELAFGGLYAVRLPVAMAIRGRMLEAGTKHLVDNE